MKHLELELTVSFEHHRLSGRVVHHLSELTLEPGVLALDTRDLAIERVRAGTEGRLEPVGFELGAPHRHDGRKLRIALPAGVDRVEVVYATSPSASGLQWLSPSQTAGKRHPFLYTQSQTRHARSWIPCIDEPALRVTIDASIRVPDGLRAVMAAEDRSDPATPGLFRFHMPQPIPSYLFALAVGELEHRALGLRSGVWAEPATVDPAAWEFADTEEMMAAAEALYGPYRWGRYDLLMMPPAFPLGGMENPRLTFASPTVLTGDRSLVALVAHELAHSWSGNLVTNATWDDFWLNEGFTVYFERRILEVLYGTARAEMEAALGRQRLEAEIARMGETSRDTWLHLDLAGRNPDEALNEVPYEKGYLFLRLLEETFGREAFDAFLRRHFEAHAFQALTTEAFLESLDRHLLSTDRAKAARIDVRRWVYGPGLPADAPRARCDAFLEVERMTATWLAGGALSPDAARRWTAHEWLHFLHHLPRDLSADRMAALDQAFGLTRSGNTEILAEWLKLSIAAGYAPARPRLRAFLLEIGRGRFLKPLYQALAATERGWLEAKAIYQEARAGYHAMVRAALDELLTAPRSGP
jgi:aminopeptidase N